MLRLFKICAFLGFRTSDLFSPCCRAVAAGRISEFGFRVFVRGFQLFALLFGSQTVLAGSDEERIPPLQPPRGPMPPDFWEQYGLWLVMGGLLVLLLMGLLVWLVFRPKPPRLVRPEAEARSVLEPLRQEPETGAVLSRVSHAVRHYFATAFGLAEGEMTTTEFCRAMETAAGPGPQLSGKVGAFLRECDERKFSAAQLAAPMGAANQALNFIAEAETRRAEIRAQAQADSRKTSVPLSSRGLGPKEREKEAATPNQGIR